MGNKKGVDKNRKGEDIINDLISGSKRNVGEEVPSKVDLKFGSDYIGSGSIKGLSIVNGSEALVELGKSKKPVLDRTFNQNVGSRRGFGNGKGAGRSFGKGPGEGRGPGAGIGKVAGSANRSKEK